MSRYLVTSALPYINGVKHLGNLVGSMLPADVYTRFLRARGHEVLAICATDEHGTPAELAAHEAGLPVAQYCDQQYERQRQVGEQFRLSWDWFGRTSRPQNHELTRHMADRLTDQGLIEERSTQQIYSVADGRYLPDRYVIGTCPVCGYERARGDQCEQCSSTLDPTDLLEPRSAVSGSTDLELRETRHLFLLQSRLADRIRAWIDTKGDWPTLVTSTARKWLDEGLRDRTITRDLEWGVPVGRPGFEDKVFYVWFDAPIGYIAATKEWSDAEPEHRDWRRWWRTDEGADEVTYVQFLAKDNVPFHTLSFPATLMGTAEPWKLVDYIKGFSWLTYYGGKFSTSEGRGVFMDAALELLPPDYWRWYLLANAPEGSDADFTWPRFRATVNKDLVGVLGNFVNRVLRLTERSVGLVVPAGAEPGPLEAEFAATVARLVGDYIAEMERLEFRKAATALRGLWSEGNAYLERAEPWRVEDPERQACVLRHALAHAAGVATATAPFLPDTGRAIAAVFGGAVPDVLTTRLLGDALGGLRPDHPLADPGLLFRRIEDDEADAWAERFGS